MINHSNHVSRGNINETNAGTILPGMQPRPSFAHTLLNLLASSVILILGIQWIFSTSHLGKSRSAPTAIPSIPSALETTMLMPSSAAPPTTTGSSLDVYPRSPTATATILPLANTFNTKTLARLSATPTPDNIQPLLAGKYYDDVDPNIAYDPYWVGLKNPGTANAYHATIHISDRIGNEASFRFTGKRFSLGYQRGKNFGTVTIIIDDQSYSFNEQAFDLVWSSPQLLPGDHFVRIVHESGETINLDYIGIID